MTVLIDAAPQIDWLAVALACVAYYVLGAIWFTPLFGRAWDRSIGFDRRKGTRFGIDYYIVPLLSALLVSIAIGFLIAALAPGLPDAIGIGVVVGLGVAVPVSVNNALTPHTPHPFLLGGITGGYHLAGAVVVAAVIGVFADS